MSEVEEPGLYNTLSHYLETTADISALLIKSDLIFHNHRNANAGSQPRVEIKHITFGKATLIHPAHNANARFAVKALHSSYWPHSPTCDLACIDQPRNWWQGIELLPLVR